MGLDIAVAGASKVDNDGNVLVQLVRPIGNTDEDVEPLGEAPMLQCLGVTSVPFPKDDKGFAEIVTATDCGGRDAVGIGGRDTRTASTVGKAEPGDTILHSTGPSQSAQVQCREKLRQLTIITKNGSGEGLMINLDGTESNIQIMANGSMIELAKDGSVTIAAAGQLVLSAPTIALAGDVILGGLNPNPAMKLMMGPPSGSPGGPASVPLMPVMGVSPAV